MNSNQAHRFKRLLRGSIAAATMTVSALMAVPAAAQTFPDKPLKLVIPFAAGGATDVMGRLFASEYAKNIGQPVIVDNRVGASGLIGADAVAKSLPDGYTLCYCGAGPSFLLQLLGQKTPYDSEKDLAPIGLSHVVEYLLVVSPKLPVKNLAELVAYGKANPGKLTFSSPGTGGPNHLGMEFFNLTAGIKMVHVPYKGEAPAINDVMGGQVDVTNATLVIAPPLIKAGKIKVMGHMALQRAPQMPDVPTLAEQGYPGFESVTFVGVNVAAATPAPIQKRLSDAMVATFKNQQLRDKMLESGVRPVGNTPSEHAAFLKGEREKWTRVLKQLDLKLD